MNTTATTMDAADQRERLLDRIAAATHVEDMLLDAVERMMRAFEGGCVDGEIGCLRERMSVTALRRKLDLVVYRNLSEQELIDLALFAEMPAYQRYRELTESSRDAVQAVAREYFEQLLAG